MSKPTTYRLKDESIKCKLCSKLYTNPRLLPCLHSFCKDCISNHVTSYINQGQSQPTGQGQEVKFDTPQPDGTEKPTKKEGPARSQYSPTKRPLQPQQPLSKTVPPKGKADPLSKVKAESSDTNDPPPQGPTKPATLTKGFPCPICRKFATTAALPRTSPEKWAELFPENNLLAEIVELNSLKLGTRVCDPCKRNKSQSVVTTYCKSCRDALCEQCTKTHNGLRSCRTHKALPIAQFDAAMGNLTAGEELCKQHDENVMEYFCFTHVTPCCSKCLKDTHKGCDKVDVVSEAAKKSKDAKEIASLGSALNKYNEYIQSILRERSAQTKKLDGKKSKLMDEFLNVKHHVMSQLEKMEKDLNVILDSTHRQETKKIKADTVRCKEIQSGVVNAGELLNVVDNHGGDSHHVEFVERVRTECEYYEESLNILASRIRAVDYEVTLDASLQQVVKRLNQFGRIDVKTSSPNLPAAPKFAESLGRLRASTKVKAVKPTLTLKGKNANEIGEFDGQSTDDTSDCWFTGALFLTDGRILLADRTNRKLKMFTSNFQQIHDMSLSSKPWDLTMISNKEVAVTLPAECRIQFVSVGDAMLTTTRSISTDEPCFGLHYTNGRFFTVTYDGDPPNLKVLSPTGQELTYVCVDDDGFPLFSKPVYVTCNHDGSQIYVSDERLGCIVNLKECGELNYTYSAMDVGHAAGMVLDKEGNMYVSGNQSHSVHVLTPNGEHVSVLVSGEHIVYPRAIAFEPREKKLLVTQGNKNVVKVYSLA